MFARWLFRCALLAQPPDVRARFGAEMQRIFADDVALARRRGRGPALYATCAALLDIVRAGLEERIRGTNARRHRSRGAGMDHVRQDLRYAIRSLGRRPGFALMAVLTLALGIGATTAIFSVVNGVILRSLPYPESDRLVRVWETPVRVGPVKPGEGSNSALNFKDWKAGATTFESMAIYTRARPTLTGLGEPEVLLAARVSPELFRVFRAEPVMGRAFTVEEDVPTGPLTVVVSHAFWQQRLGGRPDVLGTALELNSAQYEIIGVAPAGFDFPYGTTLWIAVRNNGENCGRTCYYVNTVGRIRDGVTPEQARTELRGIADRLAAEFPSNSPARTAALLPLHETVVGDVRRALLVLLGAVGLVLLIACANVANLLIARGATRSDEMAVRAALGAGRRRIFSQLMTESVLLAVTGGSAGVALAAAGVQALKALSPGQIPRLDEVGLDATAVLFALAISLLTALLFGLAPAFQLIRTPLAGTLRQDANRTLGSRRGIGRAALLAAEVALSLVLLVGAGLLLRSFASMQRIDTGYTTDEIAHISLSLPGVSYATPDDAVRFFDTLEERLEVLPGIDEVALVVGAPLSDFAYWTAFTRDDLPPPAPGDGLSASLRIVDEDFLPTMGIALVEGRPFEARDRHAAMRVALINQELARYAFGDVDPIGKQITMGLNAGYLEDQPRTVVGIVEDVRTSSLTGEVDPELYIPFAQAGSSFATVLMRPRGTAQSALADARGAVHALDANLPIRDPGTMRQLLDRHTARPRFYLQLLALFAGLAIALAAVGLYGVVAYLVAQRSREIGVRIALGASTADVMRLVVQQGFGPAVLGAVIGLCAAFAGGRVMSSLLFDVKATDPLTFAGTTAILLGIAFIACVVPAGRATRISPASALKAER